MFEHRHYEAIAKTIGAIQSRASDSTLPTIELTPTQVINTFVNLFEKDNPRFSSERFIKAVAEAEEEYTCTNQYPLKNLPIYK